MENTSQQKAPLEKWQRCQQQSILKVSLPCAVKRQQWRKFVHRYSPLFTIVEAQKGHSGAIRQVFEIIRQSDVEKWPLMTQMSDHWLGNVYTVEFVHALTFGQLPTKMRTLLPVSKTPDATLAGAGNKSAPEKPMVSRKRSSKSGGSTRE